MEVVLCGVIILAVLLYNNVVDGKKFFKDNEAAFNMLKKMILSSWLLLNMEIK